MTNRKSEPPSLYTRVVVDTALVIYILVCAAASVAPMF